jgi:DNA-binding IclR family transcriptional regulator
MRALSTKTEFDSRHIVGEMVHQMTVSQSSDYTDLAEFNGRSVINRATGIIDAFGCGETVLSLKELNKRVDLPRSTLHRFAERLSDVGWLERTTGGYRIGLKLYEVGSLAYRRNRLTDAASVYMQELAQRTGLAVQLAVADGDNIIYLERVPMRGFRLPSRDGGRMPAYCTGLGKAIMAFAGASATGSPEVRLPLTPRTANTIVDPDKLYQELAGIRARNLALDNQEAYRGVSCLAAPIRKGGRAIGALSLCAPTEDLRPSYAPFVLQAAHNIWAELYPQRL